MSQTQLSNISIFAGLIVLILQQFGVVFSQDKVAFILMSCWSVFWTGYSYWNRYKKGDLTIGGIYKVKETIE